MFRCVPNPPQPRGHTRVWRVGRGEERVRAESAWQRSSILVCTGQMGCWSWRSWCSTLTYRLLTPKLAGRSFPRGGSPDTTPPRQAGHQPLAAKHCAAIGGQPGRRQLTQGSRRRAPACCQRPAARRGSAQRLQHRGGRPGCPNQADKRRAAAAAGCCCGDKLRFARRASCRAARPCRGAPAWPEHSPREARECRG